MPRPFAAENTTLAYEILRADKLARQIHRSWFCGFVVLWPFIIYECPQGFLLEVMAWERQSVMLGEFWYLIFFCQVCQSQAIPDSEPGQIDLPTTSASDTRMVLGSQSSQQLTLCTAEGNHKC